MSNYKLIAFDMDGTLLDSQKQVRQDSLDMIARAVNAGKIVTLSTGRGVPELTAYREILKDIQYIIGVSGARSSMPKRTVKYIHVRFRMTPFKKSFMKCRTSMS